MVLNIVTVIDLSVEDLALHSNNFVPHIHYKMEDESISIISFDDRSYNEKATESIKQTNHETFLEGENAIDQNELAYQLAPSGIHETSIDETKHTSDEPSHVGENAMSKKEKAGQLFPTSIQKTFENSISFIDIPASPDNNEDEKYTMRNDFGTKNFLRSLIQSVGVIAICVLFIIPWTTIPRTDSIVYQSYWWELCLPTASTCILNAANDLVNLVVWTKENSLRTPRVFLMMFLMNYIPSVLIHMICYFVWSVHLGFNHPLPFFGIITYFIMWIIFQIGIQFVS